MSAADGADGVGPWWASGDDALDDANDPFTAHRRARAGRPWGAPTPPPPARSLLEDAAEAAQLFARLAGARSGPAGDAGRVAHDPDVCQACPWCSLLRVVGQARPEAVEHLGESVRHLGLAARALLDAMPAHPDGPRARRGDGPAGGAR